MSAALRRRGRLTPRSLLPLTLIGAALASGCAPKPLYDWGNYEGSLQASYITHDQARALADLEATIVAVQQTGGRIPPGVCAEYGFLLYRGGQRQRAIEFFQREAQLFPESKPLMDKLVDKVRQQDAAALQAQADGSSQ